MKLKDKVEKVFRLVDIKQPEVKWAVFVSIVLVCVFAAISLHTNFLLYESELINLLQCIIGGLISLIGVAIAGIAIVITLFTAEQIKMIEKIKSGAFDTLLYDYKWLAIVSTIETAIFVVVIFVIKSPYPAAPAVLFYLVVFLLTYGVFYLLFYGCALIGNCIKLAEIRRRLDTISVQSKNVPTAAIEFQLDFLISRLFYCDDKAAHDFYSELISIAEKSSASNKDEVLQYLKERYSKHLQK